MNDSVSSQYIEELNTTAHVIKLTVPGDTDPLISTDEVQKLVWEANVCSRDSISVGNVCAASVEGTISGRYDLKGTTIQAEIGVSVNGTMEYGALGTFLVTECEKSTDSTTFTAYDACYYQFNDSYQPTVGSEPTILAIIQDIADQAGVTLSSTVPTMAKNTTVTGTLTGRTLKQMLGYMAGLVGGNAVIDREGKLAIVRSDFYLSSTSGDISTMEVKEFTTVSKDEYYEDTMKNNGTYQVMRLSCTVPSEDGTNEVIEVTVGGGTAAADVGTVEPDQPTYYDDGADATCLYMENPYMTEAIAQEIVNVLYYKKKIHLGEASFCVGGMNDPGDIFYIQDCETEDWIYMLASSIKCTFDGGVRTEIASGNSTDAEGDNSAISSSGGSASSSLSTQISQLQQELEALKAQVAKQPEIQHGNERIATTTAGTTVNTKITFDTAFSAVPNVYVTPHVTTPSTASATATSSSKTGFTLNVLRSSTGTTSVDWLAIN
jgi:hypothetical protein